MCGKSSSDSWISISEVEDQIDQHGQDLIVQSVSEEGYVGDINWLESSIPDFFGDSNFEDEILIRREDYNNPNLTKLSRLS